MIEVTVSEQGTAGRVIDRAEAPDPEGALLAARVLHDESLTGVSGERRVLRFYVDGQMVKQIDRRP